MDETLALPSEKAAEIALRTQQIIAYETGVSNVVDPLGGSWYIEKLTDEIEEEAEQYFNEIENIGGVIAAIEQGYFQREIARSASDYQEKVDENRRIVVGVNDYVKDSEEIDIPILEISSKASEDQLRKLDRLKHSRDNSILQETFNELSKACRENTNLMYPIIKAAKQFATIGEIVDKMKGEFGEWEESAVF